MDGYFIWRQITLRVKTKTKEILYLIAKDLNTLIAALDQLHSKHSLSDR